MMKSLPVSNHRILKLLLIFNILLSFSYFAFILFYFPIGNLFLFAILASVHIYYLWLALGFAFTLWPRSTTHKFDTRYKPSVVVFITVAGEPLSIIKQTLTSAQNIDYPDFKICVLNDGYVCRKKNWREIIELCRQEGVACITRKKPGGAKAGNINHALKLTDSEFVAIFDADHMPKKNFLKATVGYLADPQVAFVQTPQYYHNQRTNPVAACAAQQQDLFYGPICWGKDALNSVFMCGTNLVIRRNALEQVGGFYTQNITEDFATTLFLHEKKWKSVYVSKILAHGLAPEDMHSYCKQQGRWAGGSLSIFFTHNPLFKKLNWRQKLEYLNSCSFYLSGPVMLLGITLPVLSLIIGTGPFMDANIFILWAFVFYMIATFYILRIAGTRDYTFSAMALTLSTFWVYTKAFWHALRRKKMNFDITAKQKTGQNGLKNALPHIIYASISTAAISFGIWREGPTGFVLTNIAWVMFNLLLFSSFLSLSIDSAAIQKYLAKFSLKKSLGRPEGRQIR